MYTFTASWAFRIASILLCLLSACSTFPSQPPQIDTPEALIQALSDADIDVAPTTIIGTHFPAPNQVLQTSSSLVYIYQFEDRLQLGARWEELKERERNDAGQAQADRHEMLAWALGDMIVLSQAPSDRLSRTLSGLLGEAIVVQAPALDEPFPPAVSSAIGEVAADFGLDPGEILVLDYESVTWSDTCLGSPVQGESCDPPPAPGWRIMLQLDDRQIEAHTDLLGDEVRLP